MKKSENNLVKKNRGELFSRAKNLFALASLLSSIIPRTKVSEKIQQIAERIQTAQYGNLSSEIGELDQIFIKKPEFLTLALLDLETDIIDKNICWDLLALIARVAPTSASQQTANARSVLFSRNERKSSALSNDEKTLSYINGITISTLHDGYKLAFKGKRFTSRNVLKLFIQAVSWFQKTWKEGYTFYYEGTVEEFADFLDWGHTYTKNQLRLSTRDKKANKRDELSDSDWLIKTQTRFFVILKKNASRRASIWDLTMEYHPRQLDGFLAMLALSSIGASMRRMRAYDALPEEGGKLRIGRRKKRIFIPCIRCQKWIMSKFKVICCDNPACRSRLRYMKDPIKQQWYNIKKEKRREDKEVFKSKRMGSDGFFGYYAFAYKDGKALPDDGPRAIKVRHISSPP